MKYILASIPKYIIDQKYDIFSSEMPLASIFKLFRQNTGNCMYWESTKRIINNQTDLKILSLFDDEFQENKNYYKDKIEMVVIVVESAINNVLDQFELCKFVLNSIKDIDCKKYMFSIGAQSRPLGKIEFKKIPDEEKKVFLDLFSCFEYVYLRGQYTYEVLKYNDIPLINCEVVGCPSILLKPFDRNGIKIKFEQLKKQNINEIKIGINYPSPDQNAKLHKRLVDIMDDQSVYTLAQHDTRMYEFVNKGKSFPYQCSDEKKIGIEKNRSNFIFNPNIFESIEFFSNNVNLMIGGRIHGTILGLMAGLPSMCLVIDARTYELSKSMSIPYINCMEVPIEFYTKKELLEIFLNNFDVTKLDGLKEVIDRNKRKYLISTKHKHNDIGKNQNIQRELPMNVSWENFHEEGELNSDITTYQKAIEINPNSSPSHYHLARILQKQGKLEEVIALFREAIEKNPKFSWNYYLLGEVLAKKNQLREAASCYKKAIALNPEKYQFYQAALDGLRQNLEKTNLDNQNNNQNIFDLSNNIYFDENELKSLLKNWRSDLVIFTVLSQEYIKVGENWIAALERLDINNYMIFAVDEETYHFCLARKISSILIKPTIFLESDRCTKSKIWNDKALFVVSLKLEIAIYILKLGFKALYSDADAIWLKNPLPYMRGINSTVIFQPASYPSEVKLKWGFTCCTGFIQFLPEPGVKSLLSKANSDFFEHGSDQKVFNHTLVDCYSISWEKQISKWEHACVENGWNDPIHGKCVKSGLTFTALPHSLFQRHNTTVDNVKHAIICHPNAPKEQEAKFEVFNELGLNFLNRNTAKVPLKKPYKHIVDNNKPISLNMKNEYDFIQYVEKGIIHVGANTGQESEIYGDDYNVLWIEPIEEVFKTLCNNVKRFHKHLCLCYLISEKDKQEFSFYIANQTVRSSMYEFTDHHYNDPQFKYQEAVQIKARRLDKLIEEGIIDINLYDVLVTDCQGGDYEVIVSLGENIKEFKIVKTEVMIKEIYKSIVLENDVNSYMNSVGFDLLSNFNYKHQATQRDNIYWNRRFNYRSPITE